MPCMFLHNVFFWLRSDLAPAERARFDAGLRTLAALPSVRFAHIGLPAPTDRPVIERGYSVALVVGFADQAGHDAYQEHPDHDRFRTECSGLWERVVIYDSIG